MDYLAVPSPSVSLALDNPSLIALPLSDNIALGYIAMFRGSGFGTAAYAHTFQKVGTMVFGLRYCSYGSFDGYTFDDVSTGTFHAADYIFSIGWGRAIDSNFFIGATLKPIYSHYDSYSAFAFAIDVAASYISDSRRFSASVMGRNIGAQIITFSSNVEHLPYEITAGMSYKLRNAPFRLFVNLAELQHWNLAYDDALNPTTTVDPFSGTVKTQSDIATFFDNMGRHLHVGVELNITQSFFARVGYNYRQTKEMKAAETLNVSGFSFGFAFRIKGFEIAYSHNNYHLWQAPNYISISTDLNRFFR